MRIKGKRERRRGVKRERRRKTEKIPAE